MINLKFDVLAAPQTESAILGARRKNTLALLCYLLAAVTVGLVIGCVVQVVSGVMLGIFLVFFAVVIVGDESKILNDLGAASCGKLLAYCESSPEGTAYRAAVLAQGRKFVVGDYLALEAFHAARDTHKNCQRLYDLAAPDDSPSSNQG